MTVLVVGGGITGLTAAYALAGRGIPVTLAEADTRLGGKIRTERVDGYTIEAGPDSVIATRPAAVQLADELGLGSELVGVQEPRGVFIRHRGRLVPMPEGLGLVLPTKIRPFALTPLFSWPEKARMGLDVVLPRQLPDQDIAVGAYLRGRLGGALVDRLAGPLVGGIYGTPIDELSLDAVVPTLRDAEREHRSLLLAGLAQGKAARAAAAARAAGAAGTGAVAGAGAAAGAGATAGAGGASGLQTDGGNGTAGGTGSAGRGRRSLGMFISLAGGMGRLVDGLAAHLERDPSVEILTGVPIARLERRPAGLRAIRSDGATIDAEAVIVTSPAPITARLVVDLAPDLADALLTIRHGSTAVATLAYRDAAFDRPPAGHGFLVAEGEDLAISACTIASGKWPGRAPAGHVLLRAFVPDGPSLDLPDDALIALARRDLERTLAVRGEPELARVARWSGAMPRYTVGHLDRVASIEAAAATIPGLVLAGAPYRGVGIPDCVTQGRAAAERVEAHLGSETAAA